MITIKDVAKHAGVSFSTASRAIRNIGYVNTDTKKRVMQAVEELGYIANHTAQQLKNGTSSLVGIIVSDVNNYFYNIVVSLLARKLKALGKTIILTYSNENTTEEREAFHALLSFTVDAIIFTPVADTNYDMVKKCLDNGIPVFQLYRHVYADVDSVIFDDEDSAYIATKHLLDIGCRRPLLISVSYYNLNDENIIPNRSKGFMRAIQEYNITDYRCLGHTLLEKQDSRLENLILEFRPDCVISGNNTFALELLSIMDKHGLHFPQDIKIVTFDDMDWVSHLRLSAIHQPIDELIEQLLVKLSGKPSSKLIKIGSPLIVRQSSAK